MISDDDQPINPSANEDEYVGDLNDVALLALTWSSGELILDLLDFAATHLGEVLVQVNYEDIAGSPQAKASSIAEDTVRGKDATTHFLYLSGRPILNLVIAI